MILSSSDKKEAIKVLHNIYEYVVALTKGEGIDIYPIIFSNKVFGSFKYYATVLGLNFEYVADGFSKEDDIAQLIETMEETINGIQLSR